MEMSYYVLSEKEVFCIDNRELEHCSFGPNFMTNFLTNYSHEIHSTVSEITCDLSIRAALFDFIPDMNFFSLGQFEKIADEFDLKECYAFYEKSLLALVQSKKYLDEFNEIQRNYYFSSAKKTFNEKFKNADLLINCLPNLNIITNQVLIGDFVYSLNYESKTASILFCTSKEQEIILPVSFQYDDEDYVIKIIETGSFEDSKNLLKLYLPYNSYIKRIKKNSFVNSSIQEISISKSVEVLEPGWCNSASKLTKVVIDNENTTFHAYQKFGATYVTTKSKPDVDSYDVLIFVSRDASIAVIDDDIQSLGPYAFRDCSKMIAVEFYSESKIVSICDYCFSCSGLIDIEIPESVEYVGRCAFYNCKNLTNVSFEGDSKLKEIGYFSFYNTKIESIKIPKNVNVIADGAFYQCKYLTNIDIGFDSELIKIGRCAFYNTPVETLFFGSKIHNLKEGWCCGANELSKVCISPNNDVLANLNGDIIVSKFGSEDGRYDSIIFARRDIITVRIPSFIKKISSHAFSNCKQLQTIYYSEGNQLKYIGESAFYNCGLIEFTLPQSVFILGACSFSRCNKLKKFDIARESELITFGAFSFYDNAVPFVLIPTKVKNIEPGAFFECKKLTRVEIPINSKLENIFHNAFSKSSLQSIFIPMEVKYIGAEAFLECKYLTQIDFSDISTVEFVDKLAFSSTPISSIILPPSIKRYGINIFKSCHNLIILEISNLENLDVFNIRQYLGLHNKILSLPFG